MTVLRARWGKIILFQINIENEGVRKATDPTSLLFVVVLRIATNYCFTVSTEKGPYQTTTAAATATSKSNRFS